MLAKGSHIISNKLAGNVIIILTGFLKRIGSPCAAGVEITAKSFGVIGEGISA